MGPQKEKIEHEALHIPPGGAHYLICIDQGHPIRAILSHIRPHPVKGRLGVFAVTCSPTDIYSSFPAT